MKKRIGIILAIVMLFSTLTAGANTINQTDSGLNLETTVWNTEILGNISTDIYEDFPVQLDKYITSGPALNITGTYLKLLEDNDAVTFIVADIDTNRPVYTADITNNDYSFTFNNVPINENYKLYVSEQINGIENMYTAVIKTEYTSAEMPENVYIGDNANAGNNVFAEKIMFAEEKEEYGEITEIDASQLQDVYETLDDKLYCIQTQAYIEGYLEHFSGYFSKAPEYENLGIFIPSYSFYSVEDYEMLLNTPATASMNSTYSTTSSLVTSYEVQNTQVEYTYFEDGVFSLPYNNKEYIIIKHVFDEAGTYTIETVGNIATVAEAWTTDSTGTPVFSRRIHGNGGNFTQTLIISENVSLTRYWVVSFEDAAGGSSVFRITPNDQPDDYLNSIPAVETDGTRVSNNVVLNGNLDYSGDVDLLFVDNSVTGKYQIKINNTSDENLITRFSYRPSGSTSIWYGSYSTISNDPHINPQTLNDSGKNCFVDVRAANYRNSDLTYTVEITSPNKPDPYEPNNSYSAAVDLVSLQGKYGEIQDLTLHKNDSDYFKFTTSPYGSDIFVWLDKAAGVQYNLKLYKQVNASTYNLVTTAATFSETEDYIELFDLDASTTYYIVVDYAGIGTNSYSPYSTAILNWMIDDNVPSYTATLSGNVELTHTAGQTLTSIDSLKNAVMEKLTCYINGNAVADATAIADVKLYNGNTELTASTVSSLEENTYNLTVKYNGVTATGGTVTLVVSSGSTAITVNSEYINTSEAEADFLDWVAAAKMVADTKLLKENKQPYEINIIEAADYIKGDSFYLRGSLSETATAANYFYSNRGSVTNFRGLTVNLSTIENTLRNYISNNKPVILQLTSTTDMSDMTLARYIVLFGIDTETDRYQIYDPYYSDEGLQWINQAVLHNGGYRGDSTLRFYGNVVDMW